MQLTKTGRETRESFCNLEQKCYRKNTFIIKGLLWSFLVQNRLEPYRRHRVHAVQFYFPSIFHMGAQWSARGGTRPSVPDLATGLTFDLHQKQLDSWNQHGQFPGYIRSLTVTYGVYTLWPILTSNDLWPAPQTTGLLNSVWRTPSLKYFISNLSIIRL